MVYKIASTSDFQMNTGNGLQWEIGRTNILHHKMQAIFYVIPTCMKVSRQLNALIRIKNNFDRKERFLMYKCLVLSDFNYRHLVWHSISVKLIRKMERAHERALRFLLKDSFASYEQLLIKSRMSSLHICRVRAIAIEAYKG